MYSHDLQAVVELTPMQSVCWSLFHGLGLRQYEVAQRLRISRSGVAKRIARARSRLRAAGVMPPPCPGRGLRIVPSVTLPEGI